MSTRRRPALTLKQAGVAAGLAEARPKPKSKTTASRSGFLDRIKNAPPLVVAQDDDEGDVRSSRLTGSEEIADSAEEEPVPIEVQSRLAHYSPAARPPSLSPARAPHARPIQLSPVAALPAVAAIAQQVQQDSDSDGLSYVDIDAPGYVLMEAPNPFARSPSPIKLGANQGGSKGEQGRRQEELRGAVEQDGERSNRRTAAAGSSPRRTAALARRTSTAEGREAPFTFYEDPQPSKQPHTSPSRPRPYPSSSRQPHRPSPLRARPLLFATTNDELTRPVAPCDLLVSFLNADKAVRARPRTALEMKVVEEVDREPEEAEEKEEEGEEPEENEQDDEELPAVTELKKGGGKVNSARSKKDKMKATRKPPSDDEVDLPPHLLPRSNPRRRASTKARSPPPAAAESSSAPPSSDDSDSALPKKRRAKTTATRKRGKKSTAKTKEKESPEVDTEALLMMLPRRKRKVVEQLTDSGEEPDDEHELGSEENELGYRPKSKAASASRSKKASTAASKGKTAAPIYGKRKGKKSKVERREVEEDDELALISSEDRRKQRLEELKKLDEYELEVMTVL